MAKKDEDLGDDFSYIIRMSDTDVDGLRPLGSALTAINGVGDRTAIQICRQTGFEPTRLAGHLTPDEQQTLMEAVEEYAEKVPLWMLNRQRDIESGEEVLVAATLTNSGVAHVDTPSAAPGGIRGFRIFGSRVAPRVPRVGREPTDRLEAVKGEVPRVTG